MIILGLHSGHDGSVSVVRDGRLVASVARERLTRKKKDHGYDDALINYVLRIAGVRSQDVDVVALSDWNPKYANDALAVLGPNDVPVDTTWNRIFGNDRLALTAEFRGRRIPALNVGHHMCHAAAAFYTSPFRDAHVLTMDASGGALASNSMIAWGTEETLHFGWCPGAMIGLVYGHVCERLGLGPQMHKAGSMMGLAAYGNPIPHVVSQLDQLVTESFFVEEMQYWPWLDKIWELLSGQPAPFEAAQKESQAAMDIAHTMQLLFEESILRAVERIPDDGVDSLCLGGGSFLNCNINSRIRRETRFRSVHLFPACGDDGGSAGAALFAAHHVYGEPRAEYSDSEVCYLGQTRPSRTVNDDDLRRVAQAIADGKIVGWLNGRMEVGPRALGSSSILADPRRAEHRGHINRTVKRREWFRPFAPAVLAEFCSDWFEWDGDSPFMLFTAKVRNPEIVPAITHVDGTARMQTVTRDANPHFYALIEHFRRITGCPMLLNTSFNGRDEPIVVSDLDAQRAFDECRLDMLVIDGRIVRERTES